MRIGIATTVIVVLASASASAQEGLSQTYLRKLLRDKITQVEELAANPTLVSAVQAQNKKDVSLERIKEIDKQWVASDGLTPFKKSLQDNAVGRYFESMVGFNQEMYNEAFLTDRKGANVAAYPPTSDYWQGDEKKWAKAFNNGAGDVCVGPVEFDESTQTNAVQIGMPVMDNGRAIGVLIVGVRLSYIQAKYIKEGNRAARESSSPD